MRIYWFLILFLISYYSISQTATIRGNLRDTILGQPIQGADVLLFRVADSVIVKKLQTNENGFFSISDLQIDTVLLIISKEGFSDKLFYISKTSSNIFDLGTITLEQETVQLNEVVISGYKNPVYYNHDTLVYIADSFKLGQNSTVEDLLKKLPGMKVNAQGKIIFQGKVISELLVDGDKFFGNDVTVATRNLNADGIESVQVYGKKNENGSQNGEKLNVLNLRLKEDAKNGSFGKLSAGTDFNKFHEGEMFGNRFRRSEKIAISIIGGNTPNTSYREENIYKINESNNYEDKGIGNDDEDYTSNELQSLGIPKIFSSAVYYSNNNGKKNKILSNYNYVNNPIEIFQTETNQFMLTDTNFKTQTVYNNFQRRETHNFTLKFNHKINALTELEISPNFALTNIRLNNFQKTKFLSGDNVLVNESEINNSNKYVSNSSNINFTWREKFKNPKRLLRVNYTTSIRNSKFNGLLKSNNIYYDIFNERDSINQLKVNKSSDNLNDMSIFFKEPISSKSYLEFYYNFSFNKAQQNKQAKNFSNGEYSSYDSSLTNIFNSRKITNDLGVGIAFEKKSTKFSAGIHMRKISINNQSVFPQYPSTVVRLVLNC